MHCWNAVCLSRVFLYRQYLLAILFATAFKLGVAGAAGRPSFAGGGSRILAIVFAFKRFRSIPAEGKVRVFSVQMLNRIAIVAVYGILQQSCVLR